MDRNYTNKQILGRLRAEFKGWRVDALRSGNGFELVAPNGKTIRGRFDEIRNPVALQAAIQEMKRRGTGTPGRSS